MTQPANILEYTKQAIEDYRAAIAAIPEPGTVSDDDEFYAIAAAENIQGSLWDELSYADAEIYFATEKRPCDDWGRPILTKSLKRKKALLEQAQILVREARL